MAFVLMAEHGDTSVLEAVHSGDACESAIAEMQHGHLADDPIENIYDDEVREASIPHTVIKILPALERVKTTVNTPGAIEKEKEKYSATCTCESCQRTRAATTSGNAPIMITPYRHNWLISGMHRGGKTDEFFDFGNCCTFQ